jgi:hypothetical protein
MSGFVAIYQTKAPPRTLTTKFRKTPVSNPLTARVGHRCWIAGVFGVDHTTIGRWLANAQMRIVDQSSPKDPGEVERLKKEIA